MSIKFILSNISSAAFGATGKESAFGGIIATAGTFIAAAMGGWDIAIQLLVYLMIADYVSGVLGGIKGKKVNSDIMFWGGVRKGIVLLVVFLAVQLDQFIGGDAPIFRTLAIYFYAGREGLSLIENFGTLGVPWPPAIQNMLEQLKQKGDGQK
ncbi:phage holin family protein [Bacillus sp. 3255]|uniref:phage holin family protein n=1 Tax=Bacillus sp. 3255 TaxID=2817904 RepID=UPI0028604D1D|nr:phage holin family protein [Bacillus sp. 3255]MDR6883806.1 toxin secretion/phage lysis holin [Bacillus sp. 3255]